MADDNPKQPYLREGSTWTVDTIKDHFDRVIAESDRRYEQRFLAQEHAIQVALAEHRFSQGNEIAALRMSFEAAIATQKEAVLKAEGATNIRLEAMNEFRSTVSDQAATMMTKAQAETQFRSLVEKYEALEKFMNDRNSSTMARLNANETSMISRLESSEKSMTSLMRDTLTRIDKFESRSSGVASGYGIAVGAIGVIIAIITILLRFSGG